MILTQVIPLTAGITLLSGAMFDYLNPSRNVLLDDMVTPLSNICRFAGHLPYFYSIAQHSVNASRIVEGGEDAEYEALLHDRSEGFTNDITTPLKVANPGFKAIETNIERTNAPYFGVPYPMSPAVHLADRQMLGLEMRCIKGDDGAHEVLEGIEFMHLRDRVDLSSWSPREAKINWLRRFDELNGWDRLNHG
jgi:hypothetical protein